VSFLPVEQSGCRPAQPGGALHAQQSSQLASLHCPAAQLLPCSSKATLQDRQTSKQDPEEVAKDQWQAVRLVLKNGLLTKETPPE